MRVAILSPYPAAVFPIIGGDPDVTADPMPELTRYDLAIAYGYRHILRDLPIPVYNLHISLLPWGRGASPNLWAWYAGDPHGVTVHRMTRSLDQGPIIAQRRLFPDATGTLRSTYEAKRAAVEALFAETWPAIKSGRAEEIPQQGRGSLHTVAESESLLATFPLGYETPVAEVIEAGRRHRKAAA